MILKLWLTIPVDDAVLDMLQHCVKDIYLRPSGCYWTVKGGSLAIVSLVDESRLDIEYLRFRREWNPTK